MSDRGHGVRIAPLFLAIAGFHLFVDFAIALSLVSRQEVVPSAVAATMRWLMTQSTLIAAAWSITDRFPVFGALIAVVTFAAICVLAYFVLKPGVNEIALYDAWGMAMSFGFIMTSAHVAVFSRVAAYRSRAFWPDVLFAAAALCVGVIVWFLTTSHIAAVPDRLLELVRGDSFVYLLLLNALTSLISGLVALCMMLASRRASHALFILGCVGLVILVAPAIVIGTVPELGLVVAFENVWAFYAIQAILLLVFVSPICLLRPAGNSDREEKPTPRTGLEYRTRQR